MDLGKETETGSPAGHGLLLFPEDRFEVLRFCLGARRGREGCKLSALKPQCVVMWSFVTGLFYSHCCQSSSVL